MTLNYVRTATLPRRPMTFSYDVIIQNGFPVNLLIGLSNALKVHIEPLQISQAVGSY